jgi:hypothetical protein
VIAVVLNAVPGCAVKVSVTVAGSAETVADGKKLQLTPAGIPLVGQASVTAPLNAPSPDNTNATPAEVFPGCTETLVGEGVPSVKSTTCSVTAASCVVVPASVPTPCTLNK